MQDVYLLLEQLIYNEKATVKLIIDCLYDVGSVNLIDQKLKSRGLNHLTKLIARYSKPVVGVVAWQWFRKNCPQLITDWLYKQVKFDKPAKKRKATPQPESAASSASSAQLTATAADSTPDRLTSEDLMTSENLTPVDPHLSVLPAPEHVTPVETKVSSAVSGSSQSELVATMAAVEVMTEEPTHPLPLNHAADQLSMQAGDRLQTSSTVDLLPVLESQSLEIRHLRSQVRLLLGALTGTIAVLGGVIVWLAYSPEAVSSLPGTLAEPAPCPTTVGSLNLD